MRRQRLLLQLFYLLGAGLLFACDAFFTNSSTRSAMSFFLSIIPKPYSLRL